MKICLISNLYSPYVIGGAEKYVEQIAGKLSKNNEVIIITTKPFSNSDSLKPSVDKKGRITIYRFFPVNVYHTYHAKKTSILKKPFFHAIDLWNPHAYKVVREILKKENPDVVHTHNLGGLSLSVFDAVKNLKMPLVHTIHDYSLLCPNAMLLRKSEICRTYPVHCSIYKSLKRRIADSKPEIVTAPSQFVLDLHTKNDFFNNSEKIKLPLGIELVNKCNKRYDAFNILYSGQNSRHKGVHILITAFKQIGDRSAHLHITGKGQDLEIFKELAKDDSRITFYGFVSDKKLKELYKLSNLLVVPSIWPEPYGLVIVEGLSSGVPVVGSRIGGIPELITDGQNGFLFEPGNVGELKIILERFMTDKPMQRKLSNNAFDSAKEYGLSAHTKRMQLVYKNAIELNKR